jgi:DNA-binding transcriptional MerR regulator
MYSIGMLSRKYHLSRSTLLYYDKIGLLSASTRTSANYRQYTEAERERLEQICVLRETGVTLEQIKTILDNNGMNEKVILKQRLTGINQEIRNLKLKQQIIIAMLTKEKQPGEIFDQKTFIAILKAIGMNDENLKCLHILFEKDWPDSHQLLLEFLGLKASEIKQIRTSSRVK